MQAKGDWAVAPADVDGVDVEQVEGLQLPQSHRVLLTSILVVSLMLLVWLWLSEVDIVSTASGKVMPEGRLKVVQAAEAGVIVGIHGTEGQSVRKGDLLFEFDPTISESEQRSVGARLALATLEFARIEAEIAGRDPVYPEGDQHPEAVALQEQLRMARVSSFGSRIAQAEVNVDSARNSLASARAMVGNLEEIAAYTREQEQMLRPHVGKVVSRFNYESTRQSLLDKENDLAMQRSKAAAAEGELQVAQKRLRLVKDEHQSLLVEELNGKRNELTLLRAEARKIERIQGLKELRSPIDGQIQSVGVTTAGGVVTAAQTLATIVPEGMPLVIDANLSSADVGFVQAGQVVKIKLDAYPFMQYGALSGVVDQISPDSENAVGSVMGSRATPSAYYRVRITTELQQGGIDPRIRVKPGMTVQADITTGRRRLIQFFIQPLVRHWEDTLTMR
ncbi:HlyD family type I secretion periplasmic adaptor subunit [Mitsuaria sp. BK037]|uniref:HlyD family type I secretion periplasmic adaptor subunit n=1 Tax=Mitsuaria sp. BK037 TaxID=2587122 RepID=UPI0021054E9C|nr:HlyD family type I secretion periplasmic adaptor subunit [Mitsuaria sp. BK037]